MQGIASFIGAMSSFKFGLPFGLSLRPVIGYPIGYQIINIDFVVMFWNSAFRMSKDTKALTSVKISLPDTFDVLALSIWVV